MNAHFNERLSSQLEKLTSAPAHLEMCNVCKGAYSDSL